MTDSGSSAILSDNFKTMSTFTIETVPWTWAKSVRNPGVYRDHQLIKTATKEEAVEAIAFLMHNSQISNYTYTITVLRDGEYFTYFMFGMPCFGGLVKYKDHHGEKYSMNPYLPRDIYVAFPEGEVVYIGVHIKNIGANASTPYYEFILSEESPWKAAFGTKDTIIIKDNHIVLTNMDADPTVFYSLLRLGGLFYSVPKKDWNPKAEILYGKSPNADPRRLAGQKPIKTSAGTWREGFGYTRPFCESIYKTKLPIKVSEFNKLTGPSVGVTYSNVEFLEELKTKFGGDFKVPDQKLQDALVEAWGYYKERSADLDE